MTTHFLVHDKKDDVGVVVVEDVTPGQQLNGWVLETNETVSLTAREAIPLGHKIALADIEAGGTVIKYGQDIGEAVRVIGQGHHAHVHNMKTKRW